MHSSEQIIISIARRLNSRMRLPHSLSLVPVALVFCVGIGHAQSISSGAPQIASNSPGFGTVNLTTGASSLGADWAHFGPPDGYDHKVGGGSQISNVSDYNFGTGNPAIPYSDNFTAFSWSDGTPTASVSPSNTGAYNGTSFGPGNGLSITVAADQTRRELKLYVGTGGDATQAMLTLSLAGATFSNTATTTDFTIKKFNALYTIDFQGSAPGQSLVIDWFVTAGTSAGAANATMQAAVVTVVPEPSQWKIVLGGFCLLAIVQLGRRKHCA